MLSIRRTVFLLSAIVSFGITILSFYNKFNSMTIKQAEIQFWNKIKNPIHCISKWITKIDMYPGSRKFQDWDIYFSNSSCPKYPIPKEGVIFHFLHVGKWRPALEVAIDAFLATQNLNAGHRIYYWYVEAIPKQVTQRYQRFKNSIQFRYFNSTEEIRGTCLEHKREFIDDKYAADLSFPIQTRSDMIRQLLMSKYGGAWLDTDAVPLRNLEPMLRIGPFAQGTGNNHWNNHFLYYGPKESGIAKKMLDIICEMPYNKTAFYLKFDERPNLWYWLYNDGLHKIAVNRGIGISYFPVCFTDGRFWNCKKQRSLHPCQDNGMLRLPTKTPIQLQQLFVWHGRIVQFNDSCLSYSQLPNITVSTLIWLRAQSLIKKNMIGNGQTLFPSSFRLKTIDDL